LYSTVWGGALGVRSTFSSRAPPASRPICGACPARAGANAQIRHASVSNFIAPDPGAIATRPRAGLPPPQQPARLPFRPPGAAAQGCTQCLMSSLRLTIVALAARSDTGSQEAQQEQGAEGAEGCHGGLQSSRHARPALRQSASAPPPAALKDAAPQTCSVRLAWCAAAAGVKISVTRATLRDQVVSLSERAGELLDTFDTSWCQMQGQPG